jgi:tellurite resistance protein TerC
VRSAGRRALTPFALVVVAVLATDIVFAVDSVPAVYGITEDPFLVFVTNAFALLGLRALYFVLEGALASLVYLGYGLALGRGPRGADAVVPRRHHGRARTHRGVEPVGSGASSGTIHVGSISWVSAPIARA